MYIKNLGQKCHLHLVWFSRLYVLRVRYAVGLWLELSYMIMGPHLLNSRRLGLGQSPQIRSSLLHGFRLPFHPWRRVGVATSSGVCRLPLWLSTVAKTYEAMVWDLHYTCTLMFVVFVYLGFTFTIFRGSTYQVVAP